MARRSYQQYCATARTLDIIGERWTLLVLREMLTGPKRYKDLLENLPGIGTALLAARLKHLEERDLIRKTTLPPPAGSAVYELTEAGRELEPVVMAIARWGLKWSLGEPRPGDVFRPGWAVLGMQASYDPASAVGVHETYEFRVGDEVFHATVSDGRVEAQHGPAHQADLVLSADADTFLDLAAGHTTFSGAARARRISVEGDRAALRRCSAIFDQSAAGRARSRRAA